jgi:F420-0:gamma-glutamyl ligase
MARTVGTVVRGIRTAIVKEGDNVADIVIAALQSACESEKFEIRDRDVIGITESIVARSQGNYATE